MFLTLRRNMCPCLPPASMLWGVVRQMSASPSIFTTRSSVAGYHRPGWLDEQPQDHGRSHRQGNSGHPTRLFSFTYIVFSPEIAVWGCEQNSPRSGESPKDQSVGPKNAAQQRDTRLQNVRGSNPRSSIPLRGCGAVVARPLCISVSRTMFYLSAEFCVRKV